MLSSLTHHAYCLVGPREETLAPLLHDLENAGVSTRGNPDFRLEQCESMGIDEARSLKEAAERTALAGGRKIFVAAARGITKEAQNALLKIVEEPPFGTHFFLIVPSAETLIPTLRSRLCFLSTASAAPAEKSDRAASFLCAPTPARLKIIQGLLKKLEEEGGKSDIGSFLDELERTLALGKRVNNASSLKELLETKKYARDRAPSLKLLLEHLALILPRM